MKKVFRYFVREEETLYFIFIFFPISISFIRNFVVQTMNFQKKKYLATVFKVIQYGLKFPNCIITELQNHRAKNIKLGDKFVTHL